ncbi:MAG: hypothetical protein V3T22_06505, partial [Planctomycetota bacterium]
TEALGRVAQERHARRLTMGLAAALAVAMLGIGGWLWGESQRADRVRRVAAQVQAELDEARIAEGAKLWPDAIAAAGRARVLAQTGAGGGELLGQVETLMATLEAGEQRDEQQALLNADNEELIRELSLAERIENSATADDWAAEDESIREVFRLHGLTPDEGSLEEAAADLLARGIPVDLALVLNAWGHTRFLAEREEGIERLHQLARRIDPDPIRGRIRDAFLAGERQELLTLARAPETDSYPTPTFVTLSLSLYASREYRELVPLLRRLIPSHPKEVLLHAHLANSLRFLDDPADRSESLRHMYAIRVLRPETAKAAYYLGQGLIRTGESRSGIASLREALELNPDYTSALESLSWELSTVPDLDLRDPVEALRLARQLVGVIDSPDAWSTLGTALYRSGEWDECIQALERRMGERSGGDLLDWLVVAMAYHQLDDPQEARAWFARSQEWIDSHRAAYEGDEEAVMFRAEAAELLEIEDQDDE